MDEKLGYRKGFPHSLLGTKVLRVKSQFVCLQECLDVYKAKDWDAKETMRELGTLSKERREQERTQKAEEEMERKKLAAEKKEELKKQKTTEKEIQAIARNAMKVKLKAKQNIWKGKCSACLERAEPYSVPATLTATVLTAWQLLPRDRFFGLCCCFYYSEVPAIEMFTSKLP